jgi:MSHA pilin protein MshC
MIELIVVMIIIGILAVVAVPRMTGLSDFRVLEFHDQTVSALRHAQKTATSHRRQVCVAFTAATVTLTIAQTSGGACVANLTLPGSNSNVVTSTDATNAIFNPVPAAFNFLSDGTTGADQSLAISGQPTIVVIGATGHVH